MSKKNFTKEQIESLSQNPNVAKCGERSISYRKEFAVRAVELYRGGMAPVEIFLEAGFDIGVIGRKTPKECLSRWRRTYRTKGESALLSGKRGRPRNDDPMNERSKIERLEAENAYLRAENDFLIKLRAQRAEQYSSRNKSTQ
jgi:transposase-like protein